MVLALLTGCALAPSLVFAQLPAETGDSKARIGLIDEADEPRVGLLASLRIQLAEVADVEVRHVHTAPTLPERIAAATALGKQGGWLLVVWSDETTRLADGSQEAVLYAVGQRDGRALLQVVHVPGGEGPDMDRTLAIKVNEVVSELLRAKNSAKEPLDQLAVAPAGVDGAAADGGDWAIAARAGVSVGAESGSSVGQWGAALRAGAAWQRTSLRIATLLGISWFPGFDVHEAAGSVKIVETLPELELEVAQRTGPMWLAAHAALGVSFLDAEGRTPKGARAATANHLLSSRLGVAVEVPIARGFGTMLSVDLQLRGQHRAYAVNGRNVADLDALRPMLSLLLTYRAD